MNLSTKQGGHWYKHDNGVWTACHQVPYADPSKGMRDTNLGDARKLGLVPSVTGITSVINAPAINNYRVDQAIKSALTLPRQTEDELAYVTRCLCDMGVRANDSQAVAQWCYNFQPRPVLNADEFAKLVEIDAEAHSEAAKKLGNEIHDVISYGLKHPDDSWIPPFGEAGRLALPCQAWIDENLEEIYAVEQIVGSVEHGYAGTMDLDADIKGIGRCILDFKSQPVKRNGTGAKPAFYFSYGKQLAAYAYASGMRNGQLANLVSIVIDKANEGEVFVKAWDNPAELWRQFLNNCESWRFENGYDPRIIQPHHER